MFTFKNKNIEKIAVIGSGQIGPDIALYFSKVMNLGETCGRDYSPQVADYMERMMARPAFQRADAIGDE